RVGNRRKTVRIAAVINDGHSRWLDTNVLDHVTLRAHAVADDHARLAQRVPLSIDVAPMDDTSFHAIRWRRGHGWTIGGVHVMHPIDRVGDAAVAAVDDRPHAV